MYSATEVLALLEAQEDFEAELGELASAIDLEGESNYGDEVQGDGMESDGTHLLLDSEVLAPENSIFIALALNSPSPAERDSMLLLDPELEEAGNKCEAIELFSA